VKRGRYVLIPASEDTRGHGTTSMARFWKHHLAELLSSAPSAAK
jgi:homoserine O-acetyltransferase/O-succinyltransferase